MNDETDPLRSAALPTAHNIPQIRQEAEAEMLEARRTLEERTGELAYSLAAMQATFDSTSDGIITVDDQGGVQNFNAALQKLLQLPADLLAERSFPRIVEFAGSLTAEPEAFSSRVSEIEVSGTDSSDLLALTDGRFVERDSRVLTIEGQAGGRVWTFRDVTSRYLGEINSRRLAAIVTGSEDAIISKNLQGVITSWNEGAERIFGYTPEEAINQPVTMLIPPDRLEEEQVILRRLRNGERIDHFETVRITKDGRPVDISLTVSPVRDASGVIVGASKIVRDISERRQLDDALRGQKEKLSLLNSVGASLGGELDTGTLIQAVTDAGRELSGAAFGAFFYNQTDETGGSYTLHTLSGAPRQAFEHFGMPRNTEIFGPTFRGEGVVRIADVTCDPRYSKLTPPNGMFAGQLPVRSYLAVPVVSRAGGVLGGLFFGHPEPGIFTGDSEELLVGIAAHAAVALDNARLHASLQLELQRQQVTQQALRESEAFSRSILNSTADCIKVTDIEGRLLSMNPPGLALFDLKDFEVVRGKVWPDLWPEEMRPVVHAAMEAAHRGGTGRFQGPCTTALGVEKWWDVIVSPLRDAGGIVNRLTATSRDMTELRRAQEEMQAAHGEAQRQSRIKDEFLATLSHELRTPLQSILGWTQILRADDSDAAELAQGLEVIDRNAEAQTRIIEDLLDMNRILSGKVRLDVQRLNLAGIVEESVESVKPAALAKQIRLQSIIDPLARNVSGDPNRLQQIFWNLLSNAIKFTPAGGAVQITLERVNSHLEVSITDTGEGIDPEFLPHVFERFRQADASTTRRHAGLGLGLAIVKNLVELHGGGVRAKSAGHSRGSVFTVSLPLAPIHTDAEEEGRRHPQSPPRPAQILHAPTVEGVAVLVVDDEADARAVVARILTKAGAIVRQAGSAREALAAISDAKPDVIVSDIGMPDLDGYALIRAVRDLPHHQGGEIPAIALTAYTRSEDRIRAISAGFQMHLSKPADGLELLTMVQSLSPPNKRRTDPGT